MSESIWDGIDKNLLKKFWAYHQENPHVYAEFLKNARLMRATGRKRYSAVCIVNKIRWDHDLKTTGKEFRINNDFMALYARLVMDMHPEFEGFFEIRSMKPFDRRESNEERYRRRENEVST